MKGRPVLRRILARTIDFSIPLVTLLTLASCRNGKGEQVQTQDLPTLTESPSIAGSPNNEAEMAPTQRPDQVSFEVAGKPVVVTLSDGEAIRAALLEQLKSSDLEAKERLITSTANAPPRIDAGVFRIGIWILQPRGDELAVTYRGPFGPRAAELYTATVTREGNQWKVGEVSLGQVRLRQ